MLMLLDPVADFDLPKWKDPDHSRGDPEHHFVITHKKKRRKENAESSSSSVHENAAVQKRLLVQDANYICFSAWKKGTKRGCHLIVDKEEIHSLRQKQQNKQK